VNKKTVLFFYTTYTSFVRTDFEILEEEFHVKKYQFKPMKGLASTGIEMLKQFFFLLVNIWKCESVFIWFADYHSFLPIVFARMFDKKSFLVIGGYEVCRMRSLGYGALCSKFRGYFCIRSMKWCSVNLTVSSQVDRKVKFIAKKAKRSLVPNCVNLSSSMGGELSKANIALTVGVIENQRSFYLKGIDTFLEVARAMPSFLFVVVGIDKEKLSELLTNLPENLILHGKRPHEELSLYYAGAKYYLQLSRSESFGVAIAESMLHGCVPIVTNEGGMPELVGKAGFVVKRKVDEIVQILAQGTVPEQQLMAKERIHKQFSRQKRKARLIDVLTNPKSTNIP